MLRKKIMAFAVGAAFSAAAQAGNIFVTGHDSDEHSNGAYMSAGLDYILFGTAQSGNRNKSVAFIQTFNFANPTSPLSGSYNVSVFSADSSGINSALTGGFDAVMVGSGADSTAAANLAASASLFTTYFNGGGSLYVNTDEGFGQSWFNFVPQFGTTVANTISTSGIFAPTAAGLAIGLTNSIVDADITHNFFTGINSSLFTTFEVTEANNVGVPAGQVVALGLRGGTIGGGGFQGVPEPGTIALMGLALGGLTAALRRRRMC